MTHREKIDRLIPELKAKGVGEFSLTAPLGFRMLWALGIEIRPPLFMRFVPLVVLLGTTWTCVMTAVFWFAARPDIRLHFLLHVLVPTGVVVGLLGGAYFRWKARTLGLPSWENYGNSN